MDISFWGANIQPMGVPKSALNVLGVPDVWNRQRVADTDDMSL